MSVTLRALGSTGVVAIYTGEDDAPFTAPLSHLANGRLKFHSSLDYPKIVQERTVTLSLPARVSPDNAGREYKASYNLFSHGRPGMPWVLASLRLAGRNVAATGSVPVQKVDDTRGSPLPNPPWARWVSIGANGSSVTAFEYCVSPRIYFRYPAISIPITVWVTDESF
jgi:hypothetical protein